MVDFLPFGEFSAGALSNQHMDMRVPFEIAAKGMHCNNHSCRKLLRMILIVEPILNDLSSGTKKNRKKITIFQEVNA